MVPSTPVFVVKGDLGRRLRMVFTGAAVIISQLIHLNIELFKACEWVP